MEAFYAVKHIGPGVGPGDVTPAVDTFTLEQAEEARSGCVVRATPDTAHRANDIVAFQELLVFLARKLRTAVRVQQHRRPALTLPERLYEAVRETVAATLTSYTARARLPFDRRGRSRAQLINRQVRYSARSGDRARPTCQFEIYRYSGGPASSVMRRRFGQNAERASASR